MRWSRCNASNRPGGGSPPRTGPPVGQEQHARNRWYGGGATYFRGSSSSRRRRSSATPAHRIRIGAFLRIEQAFVIPAGNFGVHRQPHGRAAAWAASARIPRVCSNLAASLLFAAYCLRVRIPLGEARCWVSPKVPRSDVGQHALEVADAATARDRISPSLRCSLQPLRDQAEVLARCFQRRLQLRSPSRASVPALCSLPDCSAFNCDSSVCRISPMRCSLRAVTAQLQRQRSGELLLAAGEPSCGLVRRRSALRRKLVQRESVRWMESAN